MSVTGLCQVCAAAPARHGCDRCGAAVCPSHYEESVGRCVECATELGGGDRDGGLGRR